MILGRRGKASIRATGLMVGLGFLVVGLATSQAHAQDTGASASSAGKVSAVASAGQLSAGGAGGGITGGHAPKPVARPSTGKAAAGPNANPREAVYYYGPVTIAPGDDEWIEAYCPSGMLATSGGETNSSVDTLRETYALSGGSGWYDVVSNSSSTQTSQLTAYVVCFSGLTGYSLPEQTNQIDAGGSYYNEMEGCPAGQQIVGAGVFADSLVDTIGALEPYANEFPPGGYTLLGDEVTNTDSFSSINATMQMVCTSGINNESIWTSGIDRVPGGGFGNVSQGCPSGTVLVGGGEDGDTGVYFTDSAPSGNGWFVKGYISPVDGNQNDMEAVAICGN